MKNKIIILIFMILLSLKAAANENKMTTESKDGYTVSYMVNKDTTNDITIKYTVTTDAKISIENCQKALDSTSLHKNINGDDVSKDLKQLSINEKLVYYYTDNPWPLSNIDIVAKMKKEINNNKVTYTFSSQPDMYEKTKAKRFVRYNSTYILTKIDEENVNIAIEFEATPPFSVPTWMVNGAFPGECYKHIKNFIKTAKQINLVE